ncbi:MAG: chemotaxis response regulator protein-glutamate methylesterase [Syntrophobacteraceae bacterium]
MLRIAIVNNSKLSVETLRKVVLSVPGHGIAWIAADGEEAVRKCSLDRPDLVLMDLIMPRMDGVRATRRIMRESPCAILIVTSDMSCNAGKVFEAMGHGALDVVAMPAVDSNTGIQGAKELLEKISRISRLVENRGCTDAAAGGPGVLSDRPALIAIGSSAGGPKALATILGGLPADFPGTLVIVQHIDAEFAPRLTDWLAGQTALTVRLVDRAIPVTGGNVLIAGGDRHLVMAPNLHLTHTTEPGDAPYKPSIDAFFSSAAAHWPDPALGILLTGMGKDGAQGLLNMRRAGWHTIAQDEPSSVVYGMPRAAADIGAAVEVLALSAIASAIMEYARGHSAKASLRANSPT